MLENRFQSFVFAGLLLILSVFLTACGGGGSLGGIVNETESWTPGVYKSASRFAQRCASPRNGNNPDTGRPFADSPGSVLDENNWLRSWSNDVYLWYDEIDDKNPAAYDDPVAYFKTLKTTTTTPSGKPKDRFHFSMPSAEWRQQSQSGVSSGYGMHLTPVSLTPPREIVVSYVEPDSPAARAGLRRGALLLETDGVDLVNTQNQADADIIDAALSPQTVGEAHRFRIKDRNAAASRYISLTSAIITTQPALRVKIIETDIGKVGYLLFNEHIATAEPELINAVNFFRQQGIADLVLDLRYNSGGFLYIASGLSYMIAGEQATEGKYFEKIRFNDKHPTNNPFNGEPLTPTPFFKQTSGFFSEAGLPLPTLDLLRVFVLTGSDTCSASESIINSLRGVDVEVIQIGATTCGKPYGFFATDNCGTTYFTINFKGVNAKGFGDYADGFSPINTTQEAGVTIPGCAVADDFLHDLGDPSEARLSAALSYRQGACPAVSLRAAKTKAKSSQTPLDQAIDHIVQNPEWLQNRIMRPIR